MKRISILLFILSGFYYLSMAGIVNETVAAKVAKNHYIVYSDGQNPGTVSLDLAFTKTIKGQPVYYIFNIGDNNGFVIVSAEDNVYPVLGYSFSGSYTPQNSPEAENFNYWMKNYSDQIVYVRENSLLADNTISAAWSQLTDNIPTPKSFDNVPPLLTTTWDQGTYYNALCPPASGGPGGHVYTGCVATAMAQIMKYHNHPDQGTGSHSYNCPGYGTQSANFGATTYQWSSMPNSLNSPNTAVATLMYHCGVSVDMQYSTSGSGAFSADARDALVEYFKYSPNAQLLPKNSFPIETFESKLKNELNLGRPVYYSGSGNGGGHAFVCDGYQGSNYFHFNWGWSGYANGYFYLNNLNPGGYQFNQNQSAMFYVYPDGSPTLEGVQNFTAVISGNDVQLNWDAPEGKDLLGYNVYRNNIVVEYTTNTEYLDVSPEQGSYTYYVCAVYDEGESFPSEAVSIFIGGGTTTVFEDGFESYTAGGQVACQNQDEWTTWSYTPCSNEDAHISTVVAHTGSNSVLVDGVNDLVKTIENYTEGLYKISFYMYVPAGYLGYFNTLQLFAGANSQWGMQVYFDENGQGSIDGGGQGAASFTFPYDTWMYNEIIIDLNNDWAEYKLDGTSVHGWQWSIGAFGQGTLNQLGGVDFYAWDGSGGKGTPKYYFDDFMIEEFGGPQLMPPLNFALNLAVNDIQLTWDPPSGKELTGYNIYYSFDGGDFELLDYTTETSYIIESPGNGLHAYFLTAVYDEGESDPTYTLEILLTGENEITKENISIFPNPVSDIVYLKSDESIISVKVLNYTGQVVMAETINNKLYGLNLSQLKQGIYFLVMETGNKQVSRKIVKK